MPSIALDNDSNGPQKIDPVVRDAIRRSMIDQLDLPSYRPLRPPKTAGLSLPTLNHSVPRSLCPMRHPDIDRGSRTLSELVFTCNLMSSRVWDRLVDGRQLHLEPCTSVVFPLDSAPLSVRGMARNVNWHLLHGPQTYVDDFLVIDMECFDLLIGSETISREDLLTFRSDLSFRLSRTGSNPTIHYIKAIFQTEEEPPLRAIIDYGLDENIIPQRCRKILSRFHLPSFPLQPGQQIADSNGNLHTATEQVELVISKSGAAGTEKDWFFVSNEERLEPSGSYDVILGRKWRERFENKGSNGYRAAPTYYRDHVKDERTRQEEERNRREMIARGQQGDEEMRRANQERNARERERISKGSR
ncbi:hypothetical protein CNMCM6106_006315 [Aspergillus hiratsukae]|uniref:Uncharacterized protein n=1 Tax=Aspergillus hiratsukae TaxID=1194566 RepID=A0A8H6PRK0_9EURO|nr:hypothetical protein CNMCM6106_006315 [Aspergillus hiratsukae]